MQKAGSVVANADNGVDREQGGEIAQRIKCDAMPIACALGGMARKTLFVLLADSINPDECLTNKSARIDIMNVPVAGAG